MYNQKKLVYMKPPEFKDIQESGYTAWHFFVKLPEDTAPENIRDLQAEIQVNTIFEDAWIELSHKHVYESKRSGKPIPEWVNKGFVALQAYTQAVQAHAAMLCRDMITIYINGYATIPMMQDNKDKQPRPG
jgi:ppGpp synthetase/RelA/SpoT-type nucleotidyltranferase